MQSFIEKLIRTFRRLTTGFMFLVFMVGSLLLGFLAFPILHLLIWNRDARRRVILAMVAFTWRGFVRMLMVPGLFKKIEVKGLELLQDLNGPVLIMSNHLTLVDVVVLGSCIKNFNCVVKASLWRHPYFGRVIRACDFVPNMGGDDFIRRCEQGFAQGRPLLIFPQGTRTQLSEGITFERGAAQIAARTGATVVPVYATCEPPFLEKKSSWYDIAQTEPYLVFRVSAPLVIPDHITSEPSLPKRVRRLNRFFESAFEQALVKTENK